MIDITRYLKRGPRGTLSANNVIFPMVVLAKSRRQFGLLIDGIAR